MCAIDGKGKAKWLSTVQKKEEYLQSVSQLGDTIRINGDLFQKIEKLFCHLYGMPHEANINKTRYRKFNTSEPHWLPQTKDELTQHIICSNYQAYVWKRAVETNLDIPSPISHGWERKDDQISVVWIEKQPGPESVFELIICTCRKSNCTTLVSAEYFQWSALMYANVEGFAETLFMIQSKVIMMRLKRTIKMTMLTTMFRIYDADYQTLCLIA